MDVAEKVKNKGAKTVKIALALCIPTGLVISMVVRHIFSDISDYYMGFWAGLSISLMLAGSAYFGWCIGKRRNPYKFD